MTKSTLRRSLGWRVTLSLIAVEVVIAIILGVTMGAFTALNAARQRHVAINQISAVVAAALMPVVADQQGPQVSAQMAAILAAAQVSDIQAIRILDSSGALIASTDESGTPFPSQPQKDSNPLSMPLERQVVERPIEVDGLRVASVYVAFMPANFLASMSGPVAAAVLVLMLVVLVSVPWTVWIFTRDVIEPLADLGRYASSIAEGYLDIEAQTGAPGEIGELQDAFGGMADQLRDRNERLRSAYLDLSQAYLDLDHAKHQSDQLAALKADFVAVAAHEIRSPLATISLYAELLEAGVLTDLEAGAAEAVEAIRSASSRLGSILADLLDSALLERGLMPIEFGDIWLSELVQSAVRDAQMMARARDIRVRFEDRTPDVVIRGDALRLRQVLDNLLSNALKYSPGGTEVVVRATANADSAEVEVADLGRGVSEDDRHVLFTLFGRVDSGDGRDTAGLGLGLAISARIVEAHGGRLTFRENEGGRGSVFSVRLPPGGPSVNLARTMVQVTGGDKNG